MNRFLARPGLTLIVAILALCAGSAEAATVQDLVRLKGHHQNTFTGLGLVVGLNGTGDTSKDSFVALRAYAQFLKHLGNPVPDVAELTDADAFAIVHVTMNVPPAGATEGDRLDVAVDKLYNATSLQGGRLISSFLRLPLPDDPNLMLYAVAEGALVLENEADPASAVVYEGGQLLASVEQSVISEDGLITLVLDHQYASFPIATMLADVLNSEEQLTGRDGRRIAAVLNAKTVVVRIPEADLADPAAFIATLMTRQIDSSFLHTQMPGRVVINERAGIITVTGNVEIGPVGITHDNLKLTPAAAGGGTDGGFVNLDTTDRTTRNSQQLNELLSALNQLKVPVKDQNRDRHAASGRRRDLRRDRDRMTATLASIPSAALPSASTPKAAHDAAAKLVSSTLIQPILSQLRESSLAAEGPFAPGAAERRFGALLDQHLGDRIAHATNFDLVDAVAERVLQASSTPTSSAEGLDVRA